MAFCMVSPICCHITSCRGIWWISHFWRLKLVRHFILTQCRIVYLLAISIYHLFLLCGLNEIIMCLTSMNKICSIKLGIEKVWIFFIECCGYATFRLLYLIVIILVSSSLTIVSQLLIFSENSRIIFLVEAWFNLISTLWPFRWYERFHCYTRYSVFTWNAWFIQISRLHVILHH